LSSLGGKEPFDRRRLFVERDLVDVCAYLNDKVDILLPPYDSPAQRAMLEECADFGHRGLWSGWSHEVTAPATSRLRQIIQLSTDIDLQIVGCSCRPGTEGTRMQLRTRLTLSHGRRADVGDVPIAENLPRPYACGLYSCP
jgi:hypothetical protein